MKIMSPIIIAVALITVAYTARYLIWREARGFYLGCGSLAMATKGGRPLSKFEYYAYYPAIRIEHKLLHAGAPPIIYIGRD
jgi:hypothetical protein